MNTCTWPGKDWRRCRAINVMYVCICMSKHVRFTSDPCMWKLGTDDERLLGRSSVVAERKCVCLHWYSITFNSSVPPNSVISFHILSLVIMHKSINNTNELMIMHMHMHAEEWWTRRIGKKKVWLHEGEWIVIEAVWMHLMQGQAKLSNGVMYRWKKRE